MFMAENVSKKAECWSCCLFFESILSHQDLSCGIQELFGLCFTPWKINGWNLQPSSMKRKENHFPSASHYYCSSRSSFRGVIWYKSPKNKPPRKFRDTWWWLLFSPGGGLRIEGRNHRSSSSASGSACRAPGTLEELLGAIRWWTKTQQVWRMFITPTGSLVAGTYSVQPSPPCKQRKMIWNKPPRNSWELCCMLIFRGVWFVIMSMCFSIYTQPFVCVYFGNIPHPLTMK